MNQYERAKNMVDKFIQKYSITDTTAEKLLEDVLSDYEDGGLIYLTYRDINEIYEASKI